MAALTVVFHHSWSLSNQPHFPMYEIVEGLGNWGVLLFFMLSGYLLADTFWEPRHADIRVYGIRRFFRIAPAYYTNVVLLFLFFAGPAVLFSEQGKKQILATGTFTHYLFPSTSSSLNVNGALWTMTIEMLLYLFLPVMALAVRYAAWPAFATMVAIGVGWKLLIAFDGDALRTFYFGGPGDEIGNLSLFVARQFIGALPVFALGVMARWLAVRGRVNWLYKRVSRRFGVLGILALMAPSLLMLTQVEEASRYTSGWLFATYDFLLMLLMVPALLLAGRPGEFPSTLLTHVAAWLGERSYSIYLWHFPIILAVYERGPLTALPAAGGYWWRLPLILTLTLVFAAVSYAAVEKPGMELGRTLARRVTRGPTEREPVAP